MPKGYGEGSKQTWIKKGSTPANKGKGMKYAIRICVICGKEFTNDQRVVKTCSKECRYASCALRNTRIKRICPVCNKEFEIPRAWVIKNRGNDGTYCSKECRHSDKFIYTQKEKDRARNRVHQAVKMGRLIKQPCIICGNIVAEAHHYNGYSEENCLKVEWYCTHHHMLEHERMRRLGLSKLL